MIEFDGEDDDNDVRDEYFYDDQDEYSLPGYSDCDCLDESDYPWQSENWCSECHHYDGCGDHGLCDEKQHHGCDNCRDNGELEERCNSCDHYSRHCTGCEADVHSGCEKCGPFRDIRHPCRSCYHFLNCVGCSEVKHYDCDVCAPHRNTRKQCPTCLHFDGDCAFCIDEHHEDENEDEEVAPASIEYLIWPDSSKLEVWEKVQTFEEKPDLPTPQPGNHLAYWTRESDEMLVEAYNNGVDFAEIASELNRTRNAVLGRLVKLCFRERGIDTKGSSIAGADLSNQGTKWADAEWQFLGFLHSKDESLESMSLSLKRSVSAIAYGLVELRLVEPANLDSVSYYTPKNDFQKSRNPWGMADTYNLLMYFRAGESIEALARRFERTVGSVLMKLMSMGELTNADFDLALDNSRKRNHEV